MISSRFFQSVRKALAGCFVAATTVHAATVTYSNFEENDTPYITTQVNPLTLEVPGTLASQNGIIGGDGSITKTGAGLLVLNATNTYTGGTIIEEGSLTANGSVFQGSIYINNDSVLYLAPMGGDILYSGSISGGGSLYINNDDTLTLTGNNTFAGGITLASNGEGGSVLVLGSSGAIGINGTITFYEGTLKYSAANTTDYSARFSSAPEQYYNVDTNGQNVTFAAGLTTEDGALNKKGQGTLTLTGTSTYSGYTNVEGGILLMNGSIAGPAMVRDEAVLGGSGTIGGAVVVQEGGALSPGNSPGTLTLLSNLAMNDNSLLQIEFSGTTLGFYGHLDVQGVFTAGGTLNLQLIDDFVPFVGASFAIFDGVTPGYDFGSFNLTTNLGGGLSWDISLLATEGIVSVVPEPSTVALLVLGLGVMLKGLHSGTRKRIHA